jgi:multidrug efflux pump subunit AcrA (membrane-fusion protein)
LEGDFDLDLERENVSAALNRLPRRSAAFVGAFGALLVLFAAWQMAGGATAAEESVAVAKRDDLVLTVGGVGRIAEANASGAVVLAASGGSTSSSSSSSSSAGSPSVTSAGPDAVFPRASGRLSKYLVQPGQSVRKGQALAVLDDGQASAATLAQARSDLALAQLELRQKRTSDPLKGIKATPAELAAGQLAIVSAQERLARLLAGPRPADIAVGKLDVRRAQADLETLRRGSPQERAAAIAVAERNVKLAKQKLERVRSPDAATLATAEADLRRAEAAYATLIQGPAPGAVEALRARISASDNKRRSASTEYDAYTAQQEHAQAVQELETLLRPPNAQELAAARAAVEAARRNIERLITPSPEVLTAAELEVDRAEADLRLLKQGPSPAALVAAQQAIASAKAKLAQLMGPPLTMDVALARFELGRARADLAVLHARGGPGSKTDVEFARLKVTAAQLRLASSRLSNQLLTVTAPSAGTVTGLHAALGAPVDSTTPVASVAGLDNLAVVVDLSEFDVAQVEPEMEAVVSVDALGGEEFEGEVQFASLTGNDVNGVVSFPVVIQLGETEGLRPGMNVSVEIVIEEKANVLQVPLEAITTDEEDKSFATVLRPDGETVVRPLKLGLANNSHVEIIEGLFVGEKVVLAEPVGGEE